MKYVLHIALVILLCSTSSSAQNKADGVVGTWLTSGEKPARIQIYKTGEKYEGKITWLKYPVENGVPKTDIKNPDKSKQTRPIIGLVMLSGFKFDGKEWTGGNIYDPESGKTYSSLMYLKDKLTLRVRGYIGISLLGRTETWTRVN